MALPPFNLDETTPGDNDFVSQFPANERANREETEDWIAAAMPVGTVLPFAGSSAPTGWLFASGAAVSRTTYSELFGIIGTTYGTGDGSTTFNLPDLRGRVVAGRDDMVSDANRLTSAESGIDGNTLGAAG